MARKIELPEQRSQSISPKQALAELAKAKVAKSNGKGSDNDVSKARGRLDSALANTPVSRASSGSQHTENPFSALKKGKFKK